MSDHNSSLSGRSAQVSLKVNMWAFLRVVKNMKEQGSKNPLVRSYLRVPQAAGQVKLWMIPNVN